MKTGTKTFLLISPLVLPLFLVGCIAPGAYNPYVGWHATRADVGSIARGGKSAVAVEGKKVAVAIVSPGNRLEGLDDYLKDFVAGALLARGAFVVTDQPELELEVKVVDAYTELTIVFLFRREGELVKMAAGKASLPSYHSDVISRKEAMQQGIEVAVRDALRSF